MALNSEKTSNRIYNYFDYLSPFLREDLTHLNKKHYEVHKSLDRSCYKHTGFTNGTVCLFG